MRVGITSLLILTTLVPGLADAVAASSYDECMLKSIKDIKGDKVLVLALALPSIRNLCHDKTKPESKALSNKEMNHLQGRAQFCSSWDFLGEIYNGNSNITVSEIVFEITATIEGQKVTRLYRDDVTIKPQTVAPVSFRALECDKKIKITSWGLNSAKGY